MNKLTIIILKILRKIYIRIFGTKAMLPVSEQNPDKVSAIIRYALESDKPCMIARFGAFELATVVNYLSIEKNNHSIMGYLQGIEPEWWWNKTTIQHMSDNAGFYPNSIKNLEKFCKLMLNDTSHVDILGSWLAAENLMSKHMPNVKMIRLMYLDPFWTTNPWTAVLKNKKVLVVHPFAETILSQYEKRELLFENNQILPQFKSLSVIKAVQSIGGGDDRFENWFLALEFMKAEIEKYDFEICLIGCGAYGFPLAAHVKSLGKKAVHMGGSLQLLFGIRGKRWEVDEPHYTNPFNVFIHYSGLPNRYWVRPSDAEKPLQHYKVENSCYW